MHILQIRLLISATTAALVLAFPGTSRAQALPPFGPSIGEIYKNSFYFTPTGQQLDNDSGPEFYVPPTAWPTTSNNIYDILIGNNQPLGFDIFLAKESPSWPASILTLNEVLFEFRYDPKELYLTTFVPDSTFSQSCTMYSSFFDWKANPGMDPSGAGYFDLGPCNLSGFASSSTDPSNFIKVGTLSGVTKLVEPIPGNGVQDLQMKLSHVTFQTHPVLSMNQYQDVELQRSVPAPLPILGVGSVALSLRRMRELSSRLKYPFKK